MEFRKTITVHLTNEDIKEAIAEYASKGEHLFDASSVKIKLENEPEDDFEIEATATIS